MRRYRDSIPFVVVCRFSCAASLGNGKLKKKQQQRRIQWGIDIPRASSFAMGF
jgi:hypothetical protein